jgi:hypothetical protein
MTKRMSRILGLSFPLKSGKFITDLPVFHLNPEDSQTNAQRESKLGGRSKDLGPEQ